MTNSTRAPSKIPAVSAYRWLGDLVREIAAAARADYDARLSADRCGTCDGLGQVDDGSACPECGGHGQCAFAARSAA